MTDLTTICNLALANIGQQTITNITDNNQRARTCNLVYESARDMCLRSHAWGWACRAVKLALIAEDDPIYSYLYQYPPEALYIRKVFTDNSVEYLIGENWIQRSSPDTYQKAIACNVSDAYAEYTARIEDTSQFDPNFVMALSYLMASMLAVPLCGDAKLGNSMLVIYQGLIAQAQASNANEDNPKRTRRSAFVRAR